MMENKHKAIALLLLVLAFGYWSFRIVAPFVNYLLLGIILAFLAHPIHRRLTRKIGETMSATTILIMMFLLVIIPSIWVTTNLISQAADAYARVQETGLNISIVSDTLRMWTGFEAQEALSTFMHEGKTIVTGAIPSILTSTGGVIIGIIIVVFVTFYAIKEGDTWYDAATNNIPLRREYKRQLKADIEQSTKALFFGQALTAVIIGASCGAVFWVFGISNAVFWGFVMMLFAFLPFLGAPLVYVPAGIYLLLQHEYIGGIGIIAVCSVILLVMDNIIRPKIVSAKTSIHPLTVIVGALGGIALMGFVGFITGPLILNIFITLLKFEYEF